MSSIILRAPNTDLIREGKPITYLSSAAFSGDTTSTVESNKGFATNNAVIIGNVGEEKTELRLLTSVTGSTTLNLVSALDFDHPAGTPVYNVDYDKVCFYRHTTSTVFADATALAAAQDIQPDSMHSIYDDTTNVTGQGFYQWQNSVVAATLSSGSDAIPYAGYDIDAVETIFERALSNAGASLSPQLRHEHLFKFLKDFIMIANSMNKYWSEAKVLGEELATIATGDFEFSMPINIAQKTDPSTIIELRIGEFSSIQYVPQRVFNRLTTTLIYTKLALELDGTGTPDVTATVDNSSAFSDSGNILVNGDSIAYTGNTRSTGTLTGVTGIDTSLTHAVDSYVFQGQLSGIPTFYTVASSGKIHVYPICNSEVNNSILYIDYYQRLPIVNSVGDKILLTDIQPAVEYMSYRIKKYLGGGTLAVSDEDYQQFLVHMDRTIKRDTPGEPKRIRIGS